MSCRDDSGHQKLYVMRWLWGYPKLLAIALDEVKPILIRKCERNLEEGEKERARRATSAIWVFDHPPVVNEDDERTAGSSLSEINGHAFTVAPTTAPQSGDPQSLAGTAAPPADFQLSGTDPELLNPISPLQHDASVITEGDGAVPEDEVILHEQATNVDERLSACGGLDSEASG